jgi:hypothetical protein
MSPTDERKEIPKEALVTLLRLEAKQVLRGFPSAFFPDMTSKEALALRGMSEEQMEEYVEGFKFEEA